MFCANSHPIALIVLLITTTLVTSTSITAILKRRWFSLIFILIMLGGMLILFIYIASLASNEPFIKRKIIYTIPFITLLPRRKAPYIDNFYETAIYSLFNANSAYNNLFGVVYLLLTLLVVIEIISCYKAPLRSKS